MLKHDTLDDALDALCALVLLGLIERSTRDLDVVARVDTGALAEAEPLPPGLQAAIAEVAAALDLAPDWLHTGRASSLRLGLPAGFAQRGAELGHLGCSGRLVASVLADQHQAGLAARDPRGNAYAFRLIAPRPLRALIGAEGLRPVRWAAGLALVELRLRLADLAGAPAAVQRVEAARLRTALAEQAARLDLPAPPPARGIPEVYPALYGWADGGLGRLGE